MARPHELTPRIAQEVCAALELGATWQTCAELVGKADATLRRWRRRGEADYEAGEDTPFSTFWANATRARAQGKLRHLRGIATAATGAVIEETEITTTLRDGTTKTTRRVRRAAPDTRASLAMLRAQERGYSPVQRVEVSGPHGAAIPVEVAQAIQSTPDAQLAQVERELIELTATDPDDPDPG